MFDVSNKENVCLFSREPSLHVRHLLGVIQNVSLENILPHPPILVFQNGKKWKQKAHLKMV